MVNQRNWQLLQLFSGEGTSGEGSAAPGETAADAGQQRLRELGQLPGHGAMLTPLAKEILEGKIPKLIKTVSYREKKRTGGRGPGWVLYAVKALIILTLRPCFNAIKKEDKLLSCNRRTERHP